MTMKPRERYVVEQVAAGRTCVDIAKELGLSRSRVQQMAYSAERDLWHRAHARVDNWWKLTPERTVEACRLWMMIETGTLQELAEGLRQRLSSRSS